MAEYRRRKVCDAVVPYSPELNNGLTMRACRQTPCVLSEVQEGSWPEAQPGAGQAKGRQDFERECEPMNKLAFQITTAAFVVCGTCMPAAGASPDESPRTAVVSLAEHPWNRAQADLHIATTHLAAGGIRAIAPDVPALEAELAGAKQSYDEEFLASGPIYLLADGMAETLVATSLGADKKLNPTGRQVFVVGDPYPKISLYLGSYYDDIGDPEKALRALEAGLTLPNGVVGFVELGENRPWLMLEKGAALNSLKRWDESIATSDAGIAMNDLADNIRAHFYRNRGFALTELGRLDDAEKAYRDSLKFSPNNPVATGELEYIAKLKAGGTTQPGGLAPLKGSGTAN